MWALIEFLRRINLCKADILETRKHWFAHENSLYWLLVFPLQSQNNVLIFGVKISSVSTYNLDKWWKFIDQFL